MWPFLLILVLVPLIFFWSDSVRALFPTLSDWLPGEAQTAQHPAQPGLNPINSPAHAGDATQQWQISHTEEGFVAWIQSTDNRYRLAVGCHAQAYPAVQVTHVSGSPLSKNMILNFQYGMLPLSLGYYVGDEVVSSVAQFSNIYLQSPAGAVVSQFTAPGAASGVVARDIRANCGQHQIDFL